MTTNKSLKTLKITELKTNPDNPRFIKDDNFKKLVQSLKVLPIMLTKRPILVDENNVILGGNMRYKAAQAAGMNEVPIERFTREDADENNKIARVIDPAYVDKTYEEQREEIIIKDNVSGGEWDWDMLANEWDSELLDDWGLDLPAQFGDEEVEEDEAPEVSSEPPVSELGKIYQLGRHRVMCGDSTDKDAISQLTEGVPPELIYTDPPYGMFLDADFSSMKSKLGTSFGDRKMKGNKYTDVIGDHDDFNPAFITTIFEMYPKTKEVFLWGADYYTELLPERNAGSWVVWDKRLDDSADKMYGSSFELCWSKNRHKRDIARIKWAGVFGTEQEFDNKRHHPTQKPTVLSAWFIERYSKAGDNVLDLFLGSGSTLIACEQTDRTCYGMELDPKYVDVIRKRYANFIGEDDWEAVTPEISERAVNV